MQKKAQRVSSAKEQSEQKMKEKMEAKKPPANDVRRRHKKKRAIAQVPPMQHANKQTNKQKIVFESLCHNSARHASSLIRSYSITGARYFERQLQHCFFFLPSMRSHTRSPSVSGIKRLDCSRFTILSTYLS